MVEVQAMKPRRIEELTKEELARRELPGGGKLLPVNHIVRIVVVPGVSSSTDHSAGHDHPLTDEELAAAEAVLNGMDDQPMKTLRPTDIVVVGQKPASVRTIDGSGKPVSGPADQAGTTRRLFAHDHHQTDTVLRVWTESDTIEYQCDVPFRIKQVQKASWRLYNAPDSPFTDGELPYESTARDIDGRPMWVWTSRALTAKANNQQYKMTFMINEKDVDPDVVCGSPPPSP